MPDLSVFGARAAWSPLLFVIMASVAVLYVLAVNVYRRDWFPDASNVAARKQASFLGGVALLYFALGGPLDLAGHLWFSAHMGSMAFAFLLAPPLILYGIPDWMYRAALRKRAVRKLFNVLTKPVLGLLAFNMLFSFYHLPAVHDMIMTQYAVHTFYYAVLLVAALMMWWNVVAPLPEYERLTDVKKMGYVFANGVLLTPACALIIFAPEPLFATYSDPTVWAKALGYCVPLHADAILSQFGGPGQFAILPPLDDQQLGGIIMKLIQEITYGSILYYNFVRWYKRENAEDKIDPLEPLQPVK
jgi:putative membrane protein